MNVRLISDCRLPGDEAGDGTVDVFFDQSGKVDRVEPHNPDHDLSRGPGVLCAEGSVLIPGLVHSHIHLDKCFLLDRCHLKDGSFQEALKVTSEAKEAFSADDLYRRGRRLIQRSLSHGVTSMLCHVEVDQTVGMKCLDVGLQLREEFAGRCDVYIAVFAQDAIFTQSDSKTSPMLDLLDEACQKPGVAAVGSAPYVDPHPDENLEAVLDITLRNHLPLQLHLDYDLNPPADSAQLWKLLALLRRRYKEEEPPKWFHVVAGHCTKLCVFGPKDLDRLVAELRACPVPVHFVGLPPSDLYMMGRQDEDADALSPRGTMPLFRLLDRGWDRVSASVNNVSNAFTPQGDADPLELGLIGVPSWQRATPEALLDILRFVTTRAMASIRGDEEPYHLRAKTGSAGDFVLMYGLKRAGDIVLAPYSGTGRTTVKGGRVVATVKTERWVYD